jgi:hypothetical protein
LLSSLDNAFSHSRTGSLPVAVLKKNNFQRAFSFHPPKCIKFDTSVNWRWPLSVLLWPLAGFGHSLTIWRSQTPPCVLEGPRISPAPSRRFQSFRSGTLADAAILVRDNHHPAPGFSGHPEGMTIIQPRFGPMKSDLRWAPEPAWIRLCQFAQTRQPLLPLRVLRSIWGGPGRGVSLHHNRVHGTGERPIADQEATRASCHPWKVRVEILPPTTNVQQPRWFCNG